jgi:hypothetical protein
MVVALTATAAGTIGIFFFSSIPFTLATLMMGR